MPDFLAFLNMTLKNCSPENACNSSFNVIILLSATRTSSQVTFPVDFFEHNQQLTEVEFGGNDLLQVYNGQQIKHRLNSTGMYVANTKVGAF